MSAPSLAQAVPTFAWARQLAAKYSDPAHQDSSPPAVELATHLSQTLDAIDTLRATIAEMSAEVEAGRDAAHRVTLLCAGRPVVFTAHVRRELGLPFTEPVDYRR